MGWSRNRKRMSVQSDRWISARALQRRMIEPSGGKPVAGGAVTHELSSSRCGVRISVEFKNFSKMSSAVVSPKAFDSRLLTGAEMNSAIMPMNSFAKARSVESFHIPKNVSAICVGKSICARCGITRGRNAIRAGAEAGWNAGNFQRATAAGQDLCQRRAVPEAVFPFRCAL
jgi:deoxycytidine triphosphate deaminase